MRFAFSLKEKEVSMEADVEGIVDKELERRDKKPRKTRYQIKQEEKRKTAELKHKLEMQRMLIGVGLMVGIMFFVVAICLIMSAIS